MNNTYSKELGSSMKNSTKEFIKEQYELDHKKSAAKISLYYAHGQTEKNQNNFKTTKQDSDASEALDSKSVKACNLAENVVIAAKQSLIDSGSATSNVSTAAANMQIAANAINKLAGDVAAMNSTAVNANNESAIQEHTARANKLTQKAAKLAEDVSLDSMQATIEASQATASTVVTNSETALEAAKNLQAATLSRYTELNQEEVTAKTNLIAAQKNEKLASANYDVSTKQDTAISNTRSIIDQVSNNNIKLVDSVVWDSKHKQPQFDIPYGIGKGDSYSILWDAFRDEKKDIKSYRLIMVKMDDSEAFDINIAHKLDKGSYYSVDPSEEGASKYHKTFYLLDSELKVLPEGDTEHRVQDDTDFSNVRNHISVDYRGRPIERGQYYVAYIYAEYNIIKQRKLDSIVGYLSQPSKKLIIQAPLYHTETPQIHTSYFNSKNVAVSVKVPTIKYDPTKVDFRVMLVESENVKANTINKKIKEAIDDMEKAEFSYNAKLNMLNKYNSELSEQLLKEMSLQNRIDNYDAEVDEVSLKKLEDERTKAAEAVTNYEDLIYGVQASSQGNRVGGQDEAVAKAKEKYEEAKKFEAKQSKKKINDFLFDEDTMKTVAAADYKTATPIKWDRDSALSRLMEKISNSFGLWIKLFDFSKFLYEKKQTEKDLTNEYEDALEAVRIAQAKVDTLALGGDGPTSTGTKGKGTKKSAVKSSTAGSGSNVDVDALAKAYKELRIKQGFLNEAERSLLVYKEIQEEYDGDLSSLINKYVESNFEVKNAEKILLLLANDDQFAVEKLVKSKGFVKNDDRYEPHAEQDSKGDDQGTEETELLPPDIVLLYTEVGEDATDNYGEPLYMNQKNYLAQAVAQLKETLDKQVAKDKVDEKIAAAMSKLTMEQILETFATEDKSQDVSYDAMIFSALTTEYSQDEEEYDYTHSPYSASVTLYQVAE